MIPILRLTKPCYRKQSLACLIQHTYTRNFVSTSSRLNPEKYVSVNPYSESMHKFKSQIKSSSKVVACTLLSVFAAGVLSWQAYHLYIEYMIENTPSELSYRARCLLRGASFREKVDPDYEVAAVYMREALQVVLEKDKLNEDSPIAIQLRLRLADDEMHAGNLFDSITEYMRAYKLLLNISESGNTNYEHLLINTAKRLGDLYCRVADYERAEEFLAWALHSAEGDDDIYLKITTMTSLASLYAIQRNLPLSLQLFVQALESIPKSEQPTERSTKWACLEAIIQNQISEVLFGLGKVNDALGWAQASLSICDKVLVPENDDLEHVEDCKECAIVASDNITKILKSKC